ncbi:addiction module protein [Sulfurimonas sp. NWX79]|uniref:addiction module protein n=1 Tax=Sulfurimonas sp. NWX79 TaxID=2925412 RepID=UPI0032047DE0
MTAPLNYDEIPMQEKFIIMEELWENMSHQAEDNGFTPEWHLDVLANREKNIQNSQSTFSDLESAKKRLQKLT